MTEPAAEHWNRRHAALGPGTEPAAFVVQASEVFPRDGRVLDVAGGSGRNAVWLAGRGFTVTLVDVSGVAVELAEREASAAGVPIETVVVDLEARGLPSGPWDAIVIHHFLDRRMLDRVPDHLASGGVLVFCQPTLRNLERHERPGKRWLLAEGELADWADAHSAILDILQLEEGWFDNGRHEARLVASRREPDSADER